MINILVVSDIRLYCEGLAEILRHKENLNVQGTAICFQEVRDQLDKDPINVVLLDMTIRESLDIVDYILDNFRHIKTIALAVPEQDHSIIRCVEAGITSYVSRESSINELTTAINGSMKGEFYCSSKMVGSLFHTINTLKHMVTRAPEPIITEFCDVQFNVLTSREQQIANLLTGGLSNKQIAHQLSIEVSTVKNHIHNILVKMGLNTRSQVATALRNTKL